VRRTAHQSVAFMTDSGTWVTKVHRNAGEQKIGKNKNPTGVREASESSAKKSGGKICLDAVKSGFKGSEFTQHLQH